MRLGEQILDEVFRAMQIDEEWSIREPNRFTWWGHRLAQRVVSDDPVTDDGFSITRVRAETDFLKDVRASPDIAEKVALLNAMATMNALVWDPERRTISLACAVYAHAETARFATHLLKGAVAMQAADAHLKVDGLAELFHAHPNSSHHPRSGPRREPDDMLNAIAMFARSGQGISLYGPDIGGIVRMLQANRILVTETQFGMTAEFGFTDETAAVLGGRGTSLFNLEAMTPHPQVGSGALMTLRLPPSWPRPEAAEIASKLNRAEASGREFVRAHLLGGWCVAASDGSVTYAAFLPTQFHGSGLLQNIVASIAVRSRWAGQYLAG